MAMMDEKNFNFQLGEALKRVTDWGSQLQAETEKMFDNSSKQADLFLDKPKFPPVVFECKFYESHGDPVADVKEKMGLTCSDRAKYCSGREITFGVAVRYPHGAKDWNSDIIADRLVGGEFVEWKFVRDKQTNGVSVTPASGWFQGAISDLAESVARNVATAEEIAGASEEAVKTIVYAAKTLGGVLENHPDEIGRIARTMGLAKGAHSGGSEEAQAAMRVACVVWLDAMLMLDELSLAGVTAYHTSGCLNEQNKIDPNSLIRAWESVLKTNYESVFRPAVNAIPKSIPIYELSEVMTDLHQQNKKISNSNLGITSNIGGEIYAKVLAVGQRKRTAAYYTRPDVAEYLAIMILPNTDSLPDDPLVWKAADFACGTGTLLRAAYRRMRQLALAKQTAPDGFHRHMMEQGLCGVDISVIASHLTATGLVSLRPKVSYTGTGIGVQQVGNINPNQTPPTSTDEIRAGSLELAALQNPQFFTHGFEAETGQQTEGAHVLNAADGSFDIIIMNPPYTRTRGGQSAFDISGMSDNERKLTQERVRKKLVTKSGGSMSAGLGSIFTHIADMKLKQGGRLGIVLPMTIAAQSSWEQTRTLISKNYTDITITYFSSGLKGKELSMSADTNMGEILLTARKGKNGFPGLLYACVHQPFESASDAAEIAMSLQREIKGRNLGDSGIISLPGDHVGDWYWHHTADGIWSGAGISHLSTFFGKANRLVKEGVIETSEGIVKKFPIAPISKIFQVGPTHDLIGHLATAGKKQALTSPRGAFLLYPNNTGKQTSDLMLWHSDSKSQTELTLTPTHYGDVRVGKDVEADKRREEVADLFYQKGIRWTSQKVLVGRTEKHVMGGASWAGLRNSDEDVKFAFIIWSNSIFGLISHWFQAGRQQQGRSMVKVKSIKNLSCPDFTDYTLRQRAKRLRKDRPDLLTMKLDIANRADKDSARRKLDVAAGLILGLTAEETGKIAEGLAALWCSEFSVRK